MENFSARKFGQDGRTLYTLAARRMVHYPDDNSALLENIGFEAYEPRQPRVTIASDRGRLLEGGDKVILNHCNNNFEPFMVPKYIEYRDALPKTSTGKIDKKPLH